MANERVERRLTAILAADVAGYSRLMGADQEGTLTALKAIRRELGDPTIAAHRGRIVKTTGDGLLAEFASVVDAVRCAAEVQRTMAERNAGVPPAERIEFRIGINLSNVLGDGTDFVARLESLCEPGGICLSDTAWAAVRDTFDRDFRDIGEEQAKNITRPVKIHRIGPVQPRSLALPDQPSIAVLPFRNVGGDSDQDYFADGMFKDIITALSRIKWLFVIAGDSALAYKGQAVDVKRVGRELGVRYVLEGSVGRGGDRVRIAAQLVEVETGAQLWANQFDGLLGDVFDFQDEVASSVAGILEPTLEAAEIRRAVRRPTTDLTAYDLYLRAQHDAWTWDEAGNRQALDLLRQAIERDPNYAAALALAAASCFLLALNGWAADQATSRREAVELARRALRTGSDRADVLGRAAFVLGATDDDLAEAIALIDRSLDLNPSFAIGWYYSGWLRLWAGRVDLAIDHFSMSVRLSPIQGGSRVLLGIGVGQFFGRRFEEARATLQRSLQEFPGWAPGYRFLAACCAHMGRIDEARAVIAKLRNVSSVVIASADHWRNSEHRDLYLSGLRLAAGE